MELLSEVGSPLTFLRLLLICSIFLYSLSSMATPNYLCYRRYFVVYGKMVKEFIIFGDFIGVLASVFHLHPTLS